MVRLDEGGAAAADTRLFAPPPSLRPWVQHVSIQPGPARRAAWRVVPDTSPHVIFAIVRGQPRCRLVGARSVFADIDVADREFTIAVRLQPGALPVLLRDSAAALTDRHAVFADAVADGPGYDALPGLTPVAIGRAPPDGIARRCAGAPGPRESHVIAASSRVDDIARHLGLAARRTHAHVVDALGLSPKRALRIHRL